MRFPNYKQCLTYLVGLISFAIGITAAAQTPIYQIASGGPAVPPFAADAYYNQPESTDTTTATINVSGVTNAAPMAVYQSERWGKNFSYTFPSLTAGTAYTVRLHFAEFYWTASGKRTFNVAINGTGVLSNFDIFADVGSKKADVKQFMTTADSNGKITIAFNYVKDDAKIDGIEILTAGGGSGSCGGSASGGPTDDAALTNLGANDPSWSSSIKWCAVYNIMDYGGVADGTTDNTYAFNSAVTAANTGGGGVVYFPAGSYYFAGSIQTTNGVVLRGATPTGSAFAGTLSPPSKLLFPQYVPNLSGSGTANSTAFAVISTANGQTDSNIGVVNLDVNRAGIVFQGTNSNTETNQDILVLGVRNNNVATPDPSIPTTYQNGWQRFVYRFSYNINISGSGNILVANNQLNDLSQAGTDDSYNQPSYLFKNAAGTVVPVYSGALARFDYANHYGIQVNRSGTFVDPGTPTNDPFLFRTGVVIRDNWVYKTMRVGIIAAGQGLQVVHNNVLDKNGKQWGLDPTGQKQTSNSATDEDRGIDWSGSTVTISNNSLVVYPQTFVNAQTGVATGYGSVDGEGILIQECCGGSLVTGATITMNTITGPNAYIGMYKVQNVADVTIENNTTSSYIYVSADTNSTHYTANNVLINNNTVGTEIDLYATSGGSGNQIESNTSTAGGNINYSSATTPTITGNTNLTPVSH